MSQDLIHSQPVQFSIEGISSPIEDRILEFCDDDDLFPPDRQPLLSSSDDVPASSSSSAGPTAFSPFPSIDAAELSAFLDDPQPPDPDPDVLHAVNYPSSSDLSSMFPAPPQYAGGDHQQVVDPFDQIGLTDPIPGGGYPAYSPESMVPIQIQQQQAATFVGLESAVQAPSCAFLEGGGIGALYHHTGMGGDRQPGFFSAGMMMVGSAPEVVGYQPMAEGPGNVGIYGPNSMQRVYSSGDMQQVIGGNQHLMDGCSGSPTKLPASDISALEESTFKVGRLSMEERKEKIHRYLKKRNERNFSKKIKYACRKTLADSRPRIRGRFAKNDEFREAARHTSNHHEFNEEEEVKVKEEDILDSSDILAHISGVNSFKYNYTLESWI